MKEKKENDQKLPLVVCECGFKLLVIPDLNEMVRCIEAHATTHGKYETDKEKAEKEFCRIEELLTEKVLISIANRNRNYYE